MHAYGATVTYFALNICKTMWTATQWHYCLHIFLEYPITAHVCTFPYLRVYSRVRAIPILHAYI